MGELVGTVAWFGTGAEEGSLFLGAGTAGDGGDGPVLERSQKMPGRSAVFPAASCGYDGTSVSDILEDIRCVVRASVPSKGKSRSTDEGEGEEDGGDRWAMGDGRWAR